MGRLSAELSSVTTEGLIQRVKRLAQREKEKLQEALLLTYRTKRRHVAVIDQILREIDDAWKNVQRGQGSEEKLRNTLIALLDPQSSGSARSIRLRW